MCVCVCVFEFKMIIAHQQPTYFFFSHTRILFYFFFFLFQTFKTANNTRITRVEAAKHMLHESLIRTGKKKQKKNG